MFKLDGEYVIEKSNGNWRIYVEKSPYAGSIELSAVASSNLVDFLCGDIGGCDFLKSAKNKEAVAISAIRDALAISALWLPGENCGNEHAGEAEALHKMFARFQDVLAYPTQGRGQPRQKGTRECLEAERAKGPDGQNCRQRNEASESG